MEVINPKASVCRSRSTLLTKSRYSSPVEEFLAWKRSYSKSAHKAYRIWVHRFAEFTRKAPEKLEFQDYVLFTEHIHGRYAPMNVQYALNIVHNYLRFFSEQGKLSFPMFLIRVPRARAESHYCISGEEYDKLIASISRGTGAMALRNRAMVMLLHDTGMRVGELLSLNLDDLGSEMSAIIRTEKTVHSRRVFWEQATQDALTEYLKQRSDVATDCPALFLNMRETGERLTTRGVQYMLRDQCAKAEISERICPHSFRHAFIHRMARRGVPDAIIALLVGHSTPHTIAHYTKLSRPELETMYRYGPEYHREGFPQAAVALMVRAT